MNKEVYILGDHHGNYSAVFDIVNRAGVQDALLICVGDGGEGFCSKKLQIKQFELLNEQFEDIGVEYWSPRGNHSDPQYFDGSINYSNFKLLPDYSVRQINGEKWLFVGGAISVDRCFRVEGRDYWKDEAFVLDENKAEKCDVLITHTCPSWLGPSHLTGFPTQFYPRDLTLKDELGEERQKMNRLFELTQPKKLYCGHFHMSECKYEKNCWGRILDINELILYEKT